MTGLEIRAFGPGDDIEAELDLRRRAFGPISAGSRPGWLELMQSCVDAGQMIGVFDGGRLVASARYLRMRQWWHGRSLPMAGVAGVKVAPEERGRGVGKALMAVLLDEIAGRGYPLSVLFPTTAQVYRSAGWEFGGGKYETVLPARSLAALAPGEAGLAASAPKLRRATPADRELIVEVKDRIHADLLHCGPNTREPGRLRRWLDDEDHFAYLAEDGFLSYRWSGDNDEIEVEDLTAASAATTRAFWQILASHGTVAERVRACLAPGDPVSWLIREPSAQLRRREHWMLRLVDAPAAFAARGYPAAASISARLELTDPQRPAQAGRWTLEVSGGNGRLARAGETSSREGNGAGPGASPALRLGPRGLAAMYAGVPLATLRLAGLVAGGDACGDANLDCAFGSQAFMTDYF